MIYFMYFIVVTMVSESGIASGILYILGILVWVYRYYKSTQEIKNVEKNNKEKIEDIIKNNKRISNKSFLEMSPQFENVFSIWYNRKEYRQLIDKELLYGKIDQTYLFNTLNKNELSDYNHLVLNIINDYAKKNNFTNYNFVDIIKSTVKNINIGVYLYNFDDEENFQLLKLPFSILRNNRNNIIYYYNSNEKSPLFILEKKSIRDYEYFGSQLMGSTVNENSDNNVSILSTIISELAFGSSVTILKGLNKISLNTMNNINDLRTVQVVFIDKTDLEFKGIKIYYDFNRIFGKTKNKESENKQRGFLKESFSEIENSNNLNNDKIKYEYIEELRALKTLFDENIINENEFEIRKKSILNI